MANPARLESVRRHGFRPRLADPELDEAVESLRQALQVSLAVVNVATPGLQTYIAASGAELTTSDVPDELAFCATVVDTGTGLEVPDARSDARWAANPFVEQGVVRAYAGLPLVDHTGVVLGTVCVFSPEPLHLDDAQRSVLRTHTRLVAAGVSLRAHRRRVDGLLVDHQREVEVARAQRDVLQMAVQGAPLARVLAALGEAVEQTAQGVHAELVLDGALPTGPAAAATRSVGFSGDGRAGRLVVRGSQEAVAAAASHDRLARWAQLAAVAMSRDADQARLRQAAERDSLTGLLNRRALSERATSVLDGDRAAAVFVDVDDFRTVNDRYGHGVGDQVLSVVGERLRDAFGDRGVVGRWGGDEFVVLLPGSDVLRASGCAEAVREVLARPIRLGSALLCVKTTAGVAAGPAGADWDGLVHDASTALLLGKAGGRDHVAVYTDAVRERVERRDQLERELSLAVAAGDISVHYQPQYSLGGSRVLGLEALARWSRADGTPVSPCEFIPIAEETGLVVGLGQHVLQTACDQLATWRGTHPDAADVRVWVNVSARQLERSDFPDRVLSTLRAAGLPPSALGIEVTESILAEASQVVAPLARLREAGVQVALDDFGTGYSNLGQLRSLPVDVLKPDRSFVSGLGTAEGPQAAVLRAVVELGHALDLVIVAEGVETAPEREILIDLGCEQAQGYFWAQPVAADALPAAARWRRRPVRPAHEAAAGRQPVHLPSPSPAADDRADRRRSGRTAGWRRPDAPAATPRPATA